METQKKLFQHSKAGREWGGGVRRVDGLPQVAAEVPEGYFSSQGVPLEECGVQNPRWSA